MLTVKQIPIAALKPYERNARTHSDAQIKQIAASIKEFGFVNPILVDPGYSVIAGHGRLEAAKALGLADVPAIVLDSLTETQVKALRIADNKIALNSGWDTEILKSELETLKLVEFDLALIGFEPENIRTVSFETGARVSNESLLIVEFSEDQQSQLETLFHELKTRGFKLKVVL